MEMSRGMDRSFGSWLMAKTADFFSSTSSPDSSTKPWRAAAVSSEAFCPSQKMACSEAYADALGKLRRAIGQKVDHSFIQPTEGVELNRWGLIEVNPSTLRTTRRGVFAGGDAVIRLVALVLAVTGVAHMLQSLRAASVAHKAVSIVLGAIVAGVGVLVAEFDAVAELAIGGV